MRRSDTGYRLEDDPLWYKDAIIYELHVRAFHDSDADGVGDFQGLTQKLDYLQDLGVTAIWLLPFYPSPLKDDGYDISDYTGVHPDYGTLRDVQSFLREAHRRGLRVITELILNHTSDQHLWFERSRRAPAGSSRRNSYVWSDSPGKYREARIIFKDFESSNWAWDPVAKAYYWHRFYAHQPDLNFDSPRVRRAILSVVNFWLGMGVDGVRLDAVPYLYEREGTTCENLPETHKFLKELRHRIDERFKNRMLLAEANQWPDDAVAYFGDGDEAHMAFHFPIMPRLFMAIRMEDRFPIIEILEQTPEIPETCQWALFLRNHDEMTLEMVTDEERDYMNRVYAQDPQMRLNLGIVRRLAPLLGDNRRQIELMNALLFSMPGTPVIYYGDEIRMGDNVYLGDRNGVRTPMQWSSDRNAGFSRANPQKLYLPVIIDPEYHYEAVNVEAQQNNPHSLLWWMKRLIALRKRFHAFGRGSIEFLYPENRKILAFVRRYQDECILVVANLSRFVQGVELDLSGFHGTVPVELFGRTEFPTIGEQPYFLSLGPHAFYWFALEPQRVETSLAITAPESTVPTLKVAGSWHSAFRGKSKAALETVLPYYLKARRWFGGKARTIRSVDILEAIPLVQARKRPQFYAALLKVHYFEGEPETYVLPLAFATGERADSVLSEFPQAAVVRLQTEGEAEGGLLFDALWEEAFCEALLEAIARRQRFKGAAGEVTARSTRVFRRMRGPIDEPLEPSVLKAEQSNTSVIYGGRFILKLFRRLDEGVNPELEIGRFLTEKTTLAHIPPVAGFIEYRRRRREPLTMAILQGLVPNAGDAWQYTLDELERYFDGILATQPESEEGAVPAKSLLDLAEEEPPRLAADLIGPYLESARLLGERTADLHVALASGLGDPNFVPELISPFYQRSLQQSMRSLTRQVFELLRNRLPLVPEALADQARQLLDLEGTILRRFQSILGQKSTAARIRCHGDYHLGQVLYTGKDFVIIDFEGEPARPLSERRIKRCALRDVAGMLRSFHYAAHSALLNQEASGTVGPEGISALEPWARFWYVWVSAAFLKAYLAGAAQVPFLPREREELQVMLDALVLEKAIYELGYELNNRPDWIRIPLQGILDLVGAQAEHG
jgi:maltose alpha-D-glucosyltransferase/alpha-amylase